MYDYLIVKKMPRTKISRTRFQWKTEPWKKPENIQAIWLYCSKGMLSFELEIDPKISLPKNKGLKARSSKHKAADNFIKVTDPKLISLVGSRVKDFTIQGAIGKGVWLGNIELKSNEKQIKIPVMSTLKDWHEWLEFINRGIPSLA
jgi:hypothetical protein